MRATSSPSTLTAASLTRCTRARIAPYSARMAAADAIDAYLAGEPDLRARRLAHGEWGITVPAETLGGYPLDVGLRIADGLLRAQAWRSPPAGDLVDPWMLLWWNRQTRLVRFACTRGRDIWVHADLPVAAVDERGVDRLLGLLVEAAVAVRERRAARRPAQAAAREPVAQRAVVGAVGAHARRRAPRGGAPRAGGPSSRASARGRSARSRSRGSAPPGRRTPRRPARSGPSGSRRGRAPRGSTPCRGRASGRARAGSRRP